MLNELEEHRRTASRILDEVRLEVQRDWKAEMDRRARVSLHRRKYRVGDKVLVWDFTEVSRREDGGTTSKGTYLWKGPFEVLRCIPDLEDAATEKVWIRVPRFVAPVPVAAGAIKPFRDPEQARIQPARIIGQEEAEDSDEEYEIRHILDDRQGATGELEYKVSWVGYTRAYNSWVLESDVKAPELVRLYRERKSLRGVEEEEEDALQVGTIIHFGGGCMS